ncbi:DNA pol3 gamma3 superfamily incomplete domain containing protein [Pandoravirus celtis]|uniref:DNA pol3 gamma3 superfamily incomplete domain containing protein n=1 Tax=Pandoravirus celtis TaxID=2568002 RepID=A0A4D6EH30_9VIRU|nr:DNA pol3 gamma3 superfamily incomplete domain containing protein [Pandoravirus celtis]
MATLRDRFAAVRDSAKSRAAPAGVAPRPAPPASGAQARGPAPAPQGEIFEALSTTLPPAPVERGPPAAVSGGGDRAHNRASSEPVPSGAAAAVACDPEDAPRTKGRKSRRDEDGGSASAAPAKRPLFGKTALIIIGVVLLLGLIVGVAVFKRALLARLRKRGASGNKGAQDGDADDDQEAGDGEEEPQAAGGKRKGGLAGVLGGRFGTDAAAPAPRGRPEANNARVRTAVPTMDPYGADARQPPRAQARAPPPRPSRSHRPPLQPSTPKFLHNIKCLWPAPAATDHAAAAGTVCRTAVPAAAAPGTTFVAATTTPIAAATAAASCPTNQPAAFAIDGVGGSAPTAIPALCAARAGTPRRRSAPQYAPVRSLASCSSSRGGSNTRLAPFLKDRCPCASNTWAVPAPSAQEKGQGSAQRPPPLFSQKNSLKKIKKDGKEFDATPRLFLTASVFRFLCRFLFLCWCG